MRLAIDLPTETLEEIVYYCSDLRSLLSLSLTCHRFYGVITRPNKYLEFLAVVIDRQYGPMDSIVQLVTYNASQPTHVHRSPPLSFALLQQVLKIGRVAAEWEDIYPQKLWNLDPQNRRLLTKFEKFRLRRAVYRLWLYDVAFHNHHHTRRTRLLGHVREPRAALLRTFSNHDLSELLDLHQVFRQVIEDVCPSDATVRHHLNERVLGPDPQPIFSLADNSYHPPRIHDPDFEGWGDPVEHYYVVEDMLKLNPKQILSLLNHARFKQDVQGFVRKWAAAWDGASLEYDPWDWFFNNGETLEETLASVVDARGYVVKEVLWSERMGIVIQGEVDENRA